MDVDNDSGTKEHRGDEVKDGQSPVLDRAKGRRDSEKVRRDGLCALAG